MISCRRAPRHRLAALVAVLGACASLGVIGDELPARNRALLLLRTLAYDRNLKARAGPVLELLVLYRGGSSADPCGTELTAALASLAETSVLAGLRFRARALPFAGAGALEEDLGRSRPAVVYACPGLDDVARAISDATRKRGVLSATGTRAAVEAGLSVGLIDRGERAGLLINLPGSRAEGADLDAALLRIAEVIR